ncbi:MAG: FecR family protein [Luteolibacter sp.]
MNIDRDILEHLDQGSPSGDVDPWEAALCDDPEAFSALWEQRRIDEALKALHAPSPISLEASILANLQGSTREELANRTLAVLSRRKTIRRFLPALAAAAAAVLLMAGGWWLRASRPVPVLATLQSGSSARWASSRQPAAGALGKGSWRLESGIAELSLSDGTMVTVQGPADFELNRTGRVELRSGRLSASVPEAGAGFTIGTPAGDVTDLGTRFGVDVNSSGGTETHVLEGRVRVSPASGFHQPMQELVRGQALNLNPDTHAMETVSFNPSFFPAPARELSDLLNGGGWEPGTSLSTRGLPDTSGRWGGDKATVSGAWRGVTPYEGKGMLRFLENSSELPGSLKTSDLNSSEQWQFIDLSPLRREIDRGDVEVEADVHVNQTAGKPARFSLSLQALKGGPNSRNLREKILNGMPDTYLVGSRTNLMPDTNPGTWQRIRVRLTLPPSTRSVLIAPRVALPPDHRSEGYFADGLSFRVMIPPQPGQ